VLAGTRQRSRVIGQCVLSSFWSIIHGKNDIRTRLVPVTAILLSGHRASPYLLMQKPRIHLEWRAESSGSAGAGQSALSRTAPHQSDLGATAIDAQNSFVGSHEDTVGVVRAEDDRTCRIGSPLPTSLVEPVAYQFQLGLLSGDW